MELVPITIVIPTLCEELYLPKLLASIVDQGYGKENLQVIVVDASPTSATTYAAKEYADRLNLTVIHSKVTDVAHQRNLGASFAQFEHLLFIDADVRLGNGTLQALSRTLETLSPNYVLSIRHTADTSNVVVRGGLWTINLLIWTAKIFGIPVTNGDFLLTTVHTFNGVNGFVEGALLGEDTDFGVRAVSNGAKHHIVWRHSVVGSARRLKEISTSRLIAQWSSAFLRAIAGKGTTGSRSESSGYPFGLWGGTALGDAPFERGTDN